MDFKKPVIEYVIEILSEGEWEELCNIHSSEYEARKSMLYTAGVYRVLRRTILTEIM